MTFKEQLQHKIDLKTKPIGALGVLEKIAYQIGCLQNSLTPALKNPTIIVFAGDHGAVKEGLSAYPEEVTFQMVRNFLNGGAAINVFCKQHQIQLKIVDAGVNHDFDLAEKIIHKKVGRGTKNFLKQKAMTQAELNSCFQNGREIVTEILNGGCNVLGFGEMGIGNTSAAALIMSYCCNLPIEDCVGRGTGLNDAQLENKITLLSKASMFHGKMDSPMDILQTFGGFEIAQMCGAMLSAFENNLLILVDGFIASCAFLIAYQIHPEIMKNAIFCHQSDEKGHALLLKFLKVQPLLQLNMRLGEGTGCAVAYPIIKSAIHFLNEMASFESAGVSNKEK